MNINEDFIFQKFKKEHRDVLSINGKEEYINSAVLVPLFFDKDNCYIVLEKRAAFISQNGEICFPGGRFDPNKDLSSRYTAVRETVEEIGINIKDIEIVTELDIVLAPMGAIVEPFLAVLKVKDMEQFVINKNEVDKLIFVPISFFIENKPDIYSVLIKSHPCYIDDKTNQLITLFPTDKLGLPERYKKPWGNFKYKVYVYKYNEEIIWGITARIIYNLIQNISA